MTEQEPYDPRKLIALLSPRAVDLFHIPGGYDHITPDMVAAALATVTPEASAFGRIKYAGMESEEPRLRDRTHSIIYRPPYRRTWPKTADFNQVRGVVRIALTEALHSPNCDTCNGRRFAMIGALKLTCGTCGGSGRWYSSDEARARSMQINDRQWQTHWRRLHSTVIELASWWDDALYSAMKSLGR